MSEAARTKERLRGFPLTKGRRAAGGFYGDGSAAREAVRRGVSLLAEPFGDVVGFSREEARRRRFFCVEDTLYRAGGGASPIGCTVSVMWCRADRSGDLSLHDL